MEWTIEQATTLLAALKVRYPDSSNNTLRSWIQGGRLSVNGIAIRLPAQPLRAGQRLLLAPPGAMPTKNNNRYARIVYEDRYLAVVDKYEGVLSVATDVDTEHTVHSELKARYRPNTVYVIHRLDQGTSGLMVFAREAEAFTELKEQLSQHHIDRNYLTIVSGKVEPAEGTWQSYLYEDKRYYVHSTDNPSGGDLAITHYRTLAHHRDFTLLHVTLATGKKNQIRVHCQRAGHPVVGDDKYGGDTKAMSRLALHACALSFAHPITKHPLAFTSAVPYGFTKLIPASLWSKLPFTLAPKEQHRGRS